EGVMKGVSEVRQQRLGAIRFQNPAFLRPEPGPIRVGADVFAQTAQDLGRVVGGELGLQGGEELRNALKGREDLLHAWRSLVEVLDEDVLQLGEPALLVAGVGKQGACEEFELQGEVEEAVAEHARDVKVEAG